MHASNPYQRHPADAGRVAVFSVMDASMKRLTLVYPPFRSQLPTRSVHRSR